MAEDTSAGFPRFESGLADMPLKRNAAEIKSLFFQGAKPIPYGNFTAMTDDSSGTILLENVIALDPTKTNHEAGEEVRENFNLLIFLSKDASFLKKIADSFEPQDFELCLFIEDNSTDNFSGTFTQQMHDHSYGYSTEESYVVVSLQPATFKPIIEDWLNTNHDEFTTLTQSLGVDIDLTRAQLAQLMTDGKIESSDLWFVRTIIGVIQKVNYFAGVVYDQIGQVILDVTKAVRYIRIDEYHWNPEVMQTDAGEAIDNSNFTPFLIPFGHEIIDGLADMGQEGMLMVIEKLERQLGKEKAKARRKINQLHRLRGVPVVVKKDLKRFLKNCEDYLEMGFEIIKSTCAEVVPFLASMGKKWLNIVNAYYCGLWNALVEAVLGLVDLVGYAFKGIGFIYNANSAMPDVLPYALELIDEAYQTIQKTNFSALLTSGINSAIDMLKGFDFSTLSAPTISLEKIAYYIGCFAGFIIEILVSIPSGGTTAIVGTLSKFSPIGTNLLAYFTRMLKTLFGTVKKAGEVSLEVALNIIRYVIDVLKGGAAKLVELMRSVEDLIKYGFKFIDEIFTALQRQFDEFLSAIPDSVLYTKDEVADGWNDLKRIFDEDELTDFGQSMFCTIV